MEPFPVDGGFWWEKHSCVMAKKENMVIVFGLNGIIFG
jgi:hypothetical protein